MSKQTPPKQKLLQILKRNRPLKIGEIMKYFSISEIAVRKHIHELEKQGLINKVSHKQPIGRPFLTYELTKKGHETFPNQNDRLPAELLKDLEELQGPEAVYELLEKRMEREFDCYKKAISSNDNLEKQINYITHLQNENGYMAEIEKTDEGDFIIKNYNCPISSIASTYHQVCKNEHRMLEKLFSENEVTAQAFITKGDHFCKWVVKNPNIND
ncbi:helix-turn-helix transcriptional regulator [Oceanobacillus senegalensis]|uniref:helix-turn-helix transcriptional regulator n=1 Tax=Oceanobacillus senegalensis TaxID=1936063 RepID=UPI0015C4C69C|nr:HTH domain-containing protein [Oceanobacillus senegalensis]